MRDRLPIVISPTALVVTMLGVTPPVEAVVRGQALEEEADEDPGVATSASTDWSTGLRPSPAVRCSLLH
jgi:hypothetical protein